METGQKVFLLVFLSVGVLFIYIVLIRPSSSDSDEFNSEFQQSGNESTEQPNTTTEITLNITTANETDASDQNVDVTKVLPFKVVPLRNSKSRKIIADAESEKEEENKSPEEGKDKEKSDQIVNADENTSKEEGQGKGQGELPPVTQGRQQTKNRNDEEDEREEK